MSTITVAAPIVDYKAGGIEGSLALASLPDATLQAILVYGARRYIQDPANSARHAAAVAAWDALGAEGQAGKVRKDFLKDFAFDMAPVLESILADMLAGVVGRSAAGPRVTPVESKALSTFWQDVKDGKAPGAKLAAYQIKAVTKAGTDKVNEVRAGLWGELTDEQRQVYLDDAAELIEFEARRAAKRAAAAAEITGEALKI